MAETMERRREQRCVKDVGMHYSLLNHTTEHPVVIRNFSKSGLYFESNQSLQPGVLVVLRSIDGDKRVDNKILPSFAMQNNDPESCSTYRSHTLVSVKRSTKLEKTDGQNSFGIGATVQIIAD